MIQSILTLLIELGILGADIRHEHKVRQQERREGKKRPFSKYLLQPSILAGLIIFGLLLLSAPLLLGSMSEKRRQNTIEEMNEIKATLEEWRKVYHSYPTELKEITRGRPLRKAWLNPYVSKPKHWR